MKLSVVLVAPLVIMAVGTGVLCAPYLQAETTYRHIEELADSETSTSTERAEQVTSESANRIIDWTALHTINPDVIGWIEVPNTSIDYPLVQAHPSNPNRYLHTTFDGDTPRWGSSGTIYLSSSCEQDGLAASMPVIYGHALADGSMFTPFSKNADSAVLASHPDVIIYTPRETIHIKLFAANIVNAENERVVTGLQGAALHEWIESRLQESEAVLTRPQNVQQLWTFVTCSVSTWTNQRTLTYGLTTSRMPAA